VGVLVSMASVSEPNFTPLGRTIGNSGVIRPLTVPLKMPSSRDMFRPVTVGIGCLCHQSNRPGVIALALDTRMTYVAGDAVCGTHDLTSKLFSLPLGCLGIVAGTFSQCERFVSYLWDRMTTTTQKVKEVELDHVVHAATYANHQVRLSLFENALVSNMGLTRHEWLDRISSDPRLRRAGRWMAKRIEPDVQSIVAGFIQSRPVLLRVSGKEPVEEEPSHTVIGSGGGFALQKLAFRTQGPYASVQRTALAMSEALRFARRKDGYVGPPAYGILLWPGGIAKQYDTTEALLRNWSRSIKKADTPSLDSQERWNEFEVLLTPFLIGKG
jgi:hypothetical protein